MVSKRIKHDPNSAPLGELRQRTEELLRKTRTEVAAMPTEDIQTLVYELQVYQTELEMQNDELHKAEVKLQESRDRYIDLYDSAPVGYLTLDRNTYVEEANLAAARLLNIERRDLIGQPLARFFDQDSSDKLHLHVREAFAKCTKQSCELVGTASNGNTLHAVLESYGTLNDDLPRCHTLLSDITDIKRAEEKLVGFGRIIEDSLNEIYVFDAVSLRFLVVNQGARDNLGYSMPELQDLTPLKLNPEFTANTFAKLIRPLNTGEQSLIEFGTTYRRKDGSVYPVEVHLQLTNFQGSSAYVAIVVDISRRQRAERELAGHKRALELLASGASLKQVMHALVEVAEAMCPGMVGSVLILDQNANRFVDSYAPGLPDFYNDTLAGLSIGEGVGSCGTAARTGQRVIVEDMMTHPYWAGYRDLARKARLRACWSEPVLSTKGAILGTFAMYCREPRVPDERDLTLIRTSANMAALAIEQKRNEQVIKEAHDRLERRVEERTSDLVTANQRVKSALEDLEADEQLLRRLIDLQEQERRMVAHEIHDGFVQDVVGAHMHVQSIESTSDPEANEAVAVQVAELLEKAIAEGRRLIREMRPMVLDEEGVIESLRHLIADENASGGLVVAFDHKVRFDRLDPRLEGAIFRIVQEALNNVKKHGETDHAAVQLTQSDDQLEVVVRDHGVGFDPEMVPPDRFGLRGIRERARLFGGTAKIESVPGEGTAIHVRFQIDAQPPPDAISSAESTELRI